MTELNPVPNNQTQQVAGSGRPAGAGRTEPAQRARAALANTKYSATEKLAILRAYAASPEGMRAFCAQQDDFCRIWGVGRSTLAKWLKRYREEGPQGLETRRWRTRAPHPNATPEDVKERVRETKRRHPSFGLRKIRDWLFRFEAKKISTTTVKNVLVEADLHTAPKVKNKRRKKPIVRRFERAKPRELWQSDITSFLLPRTGRRLYLTVFLDDHSRYIVGWQLATHQRVELVVEALLEGIARFGKPREVLTDQGRQYFAWRGKSRFQKLLHKEGIQHVVSRAHHPQTLGKTERFWATVNAELWERVRMEDLVEARRRMSHFIQHYNHFRPHQGIDGAVPADRFFGAEDAMRATLEGNMQQELDRALAEPKREAVYLFGRVGDQSVSLHGEGGRLIVRTEGGEERELDMNALGGAGDDGKEDANRKEASEVSSAGADADGRARALEVGDGRGTSARASAGDGDPGALAGEEVEAGGGRGTGGEAATNLAALSDGGIGYGRGLTEAAAERPCSGGDESRRGSDSAEEAHPSTRERGERDAATGAVDPGSPSDSRGGKPWDEDGRRSYEDDWEENSEDFDEETWE